MSIKPSVVYIKGVHDIADPNPSTAPDIGFPQLELEKLFEGATIKETTDTAYDSSKKYIYYDSLSSQVAIQDAGHFNCIKNGYYSIANGINHYYTKSGDNYNYNAVPDISTWAGKRSFSNTIKNTDLYSISPESERICIGNTYYKKNDNNYVKQTLKTYTLYETVDISWQDQDKYKCRKYAIDANTIGYNWKNTNGKLAESGYYISVLRQTEESAGSNIHYIIQLQYMSFTGGVWDYNPKISPLTIYKFNYDSIDSLYVQNEGHLDDPTSQVLFTSDPTTTIQYFYHKIDTWLYPNTLSPNITPDLMTDLNDTLLSYSAANYPLYSEATATVINKISNSTYTIYEKTAVKINYNYRGDANSLKFIFTDKDIDGVLEACNLPNSVKKYVHLTNLEYNK